MRIILFELQLFLLSWRQYFGSDVAALVKMTESWQGKQPPVSLAAMDLVRPEHIEKVSILNAITDN
jgi:hypothetical protein